MFIVFDLDGTLALNDHRQHFVQRPVGEKDWKRFFEACDKDTPNMPIIRTALAFDAIGERVEIWSGRSAVVNEKTEKWLALNGIGHLPRRMRPEDDRTPDHELKEAWFDECDRKPDLIFDDRDSVVEMWRRKGVVCAQVAPGAF